MKKTAKLLGILAIMAIIGLGFGGCPDEPGSEPGHQSPILFQPPELELEQEPIGNLAFVLINDGKAYSVSQGDINTAIVTIPAVYKGLPVVEIENSGFSSNTKVKTIIIPEGITRIGEYAFFHCNNLESAVIPLGLKSIGNFAFSSCEKFDQVFYCGTDGTTWKTITVGSNNTNLINANFYYYSLSFLGTYNTHWIYINSVPVIWGLTPGLSFTLMDDGGAYSVSGGSVTEAEVIIPPVYNGLPVIEIGDGGFDGMSQLTSIFIPDSVTSIGGAAFYGCTGLTSITIPNSVTWIGRNAFWGCSSLTSITIPSSVTSIGWDAFRGCINLSITWNYNPAAVVEKNYNEYDIYLQSYLKTVIISNSVTSIGYEAFNGCTGLMSITIPSSVTSIGDFAFNGCTGLMSITIPSSVTSIGDFAFSGCTGLTSITVDSANTVYRSEGNCIIYKSDNTLIAGCKTSVIPNSVTSI